MIRFILGLSILIVSGLAETKLERLMQKCDNNDSSACQDIAIIYKHGRGVETSAQKYLEYYTKACDLDVSYCDYIGEIYEYEYKGIPKNLTKAIEYYKRYCDSKYEDLESCQKVGQAYATGDGVPKDFKIASEYYKKACKHDQYGGVCIRSNTLNAIVEVGGESLTVSVLEKSCDEKKNLFSCGVVAGMYWDGDDLGDDFIPSEKAPKDLDKAYEYFIKACAIGKDVDLSCRYAKKTLDEIKAQETNASIKAK